MSSHFIRFFTVFFIVYTGANSYVGWHFFQAFHMMIDPYGLTYWFFYLLLALSPFIARIGKEYFSRYINDILAVAGGYWLAAVYYFVLLWGVADVSRLLLRFIVPSSPLIRQASLYLGIGFIVLVAVLFVYGTYNARQPHRVHYDITVHKKVPGLSEIHAVMVSDIHLGSIVGNDRLVSLVNRINELNPDIVFFAGDTIDEDVRVFVEQKMPDVIVKLHPKYGTYAVLGNHEYIGGSSKLAVQYLEEAGVKVLLDHCVKVNDQFYIIGRDDRASLAVNGRQRLDLCRLMEGVDKKLPVILLDHQPYHLDEGEKNGVDLQLSGHTHHGQFFPNNLITAQVYEQDWGYLRKGEYQAIVSCGFGTWGPPIRIGSYPEIIDITIFLGNK